MRRFLYNLIYSLIPVDWIFGSTSKIENFVDLAVDGRIKPGRAVTLGCGVGRETFHLAKKGFNVIGIDYSQVAIQKAQRRTKKEGLEIDFFVDDLTDLKHIEGTFDLVMDFGALNDMDQKSRDLYIQNVQPLITPGGTYVMFCFESMLPSEEVMTRFGPSFSVSVLNEKKELPGTLTLYSMVRH